MGEAPNALISQDHAAIHRAPPFLSGESSKGHRARPRCALLTTKPGRQAAWEPSQIGGYPSRWNAAHTQESAPGRRRRGRGLRRTGVTDIRSAGSLPIMRGQSRESHTTVRRHRLVSGRSPSSGGWRPARCCSPASRRHFGQAERPQSARGPLAESRCSRGRASGMGGVARAGSGPKRLSSRDYSTAQHAPGRRADGGDWFVAPDVLPNPTRPECAALATLGCYPAGAG